MKAKDIFFEVDGVQMTGKDLIHCVVLTACIGESMLLDMTKATPEYRAAYYKAKAVYSAAKENINDSN
jgi:hypothetical protein